MNSGKIALKQIWKLFILLLLGSVLLEVLVFNSAAWRSVGATHQKLNYSRGGDTIFASDMTGEPGYLYLGVNAYGEGGGQLPVTVRIEIQDAGQSEFYALPEVTIYPVMEKSKYLPVYSYGNVEHMVVSFETVSAAEIQLTEVVYDAKVPWFLSGVRMILIAVFLGACWCLRPSSLIYKWQWNGKWKVVAVGLLIAANILLFLFLVRSNPVFLNPVWPYHQQYHKLAVSLSEGRVWVDVAEEQTLEALQKLENPYDTGVRMSTVPGAGNVWDIAYFEGKFYVYFGIVPVLIFYLPYYLLTRSAFPTWLGVFAAGVGVVGGVYYLLERVRRKWFPGMSFTWYLLLAAVCSNCLNLNCAMLHADFYYLPILMALGFTLWGLGLMVSVVDDWEQKSKGLYVRLALGALCLALTAGCRPQFLVASFLLIPLFGPILRQNWKSGGQRQILSRLLVTAVPYVLVAAGLMYYNYIRFGSVFDFGANYNLTTNDMTQRGFHLGRLPDGIFMYLFQPINFTTTFPFAEITDFCSNYLGNTIRDWTFGGVIWTRPLLLLLPGILLVKKELVHKKLYGFSVLSVCLTLVVVAADTEMAGILNRYCTDFLWLLLIPTIIILMQLMETYQGTSGGRWLIVLVLIVGAFSVFYELAISVTAGELIRDNVHRYYLIKSLFQ